MKKVICFILAAIFFLSLCSCAKEQQKDVGVTDEEMMVKMLSDLSKKNFADIASRSVLKDGTAVKEEDIKSIYDFLVSTGADPSLGFSVDTCSKSINVNASDKTDSRTYLLTTLCGGKSVPFTITVLHTDNGVFFTQIYTTGAVKDGETDADET